MSRDGADDDVFVEEYTLPSWEELRAQNVERTTGYDQQVIERTEAMADHVEPQTTRFVVAG